MLAVTLLCLAGVDAPVAEPPPAPPLVEVPAPVQAVEEVEPAPEPDPLPTDDGQGKLVAGGVMLGGGLVVAALGIVWLASPSGKSLTSINCSGGFVGEGVFFCIVGGIIAVLPLVAGLLLGGGGSALLAVGKVRRSKYHEARGIVP